MKAKRDGASAIPYTLIRIVLVGAIINRPLRMCRCPKTGGCGHPPLRCWFWVGCKTTNRFVGADSKSARNRFCTKFTGRETRPLQSSHKRDRRGDHRSPARSVQPLTGGPVYSFFKPSPSRLRRATSPEGRRLPSLHKTVNRFVGADIIRPFFTAPDTTARWRARDDSRCETAAAPARAAATARRRRWICPRALAVRSPPARTPR